MTTPVARPGDPPACRALYIHVPFCRTLCGYCDFYSQVLDPAAVGPLVDALLRELSEQAGPRGLEFDTVYVGGGTPTVLPVGELERLLLGLRGYVAQHAAGQSPALRSLSGGATPHAPTDVEFTVEANPATVTEAVAEVLARCAVNRVSIGAQSFNPAELRVLDRAHRPEQVAETVATCRRLGLRRISLDLIFGIPGQTLASWRDTLGAALALEPEHLSCYGLTYEAGTPLAEQVQDGGAKQRFALPDDGPNQRFALPAGRVQRVDPDVEADMYEAALDLLPAAGLHHYEISNFARPGCECRHNLRYWHNEPYLGIGPAAAGYIGEEPICQPPDVSHEPVHQPPSLSGRGGGRVRYKNVADTAAYVSAISAGRSPRVEEECLAEERRARETAMLELRLTAGIDRRRFIERYGVDPRELFADALAEDGGAGLLEVDDRAIRLTRRGLLVADTVMADFV
jgi:oxygen-independent coproporphyrinogen-3 oxidase